MQHETVLCVATRRWNSLWRNTQQIISRIATNNRVLYFEPGRDPDRPHGAEMLRNWPNFFRLTTTTIHQNLIVIPTPANLPFMRASLPQPVLQQTMPLVAKLNAQILIRHIRRAIQAFQVESPILWLYEPRHIDLVGKFGEKLVCYYNYDEMPDFAGNERIRDMLRAYDDRLSSRADVVFASSRGQTERRKKLNPNTYFIPNAVNFELFNRTLDPATPIAADIAGLKRPVIGFVGWLGYQIDVDLLIHVAKAYPAASLVLVGPDCLPNDARREQLRSLPNVFLPGKKELNDIPGYLKAFDVALIPYAVSGHALTIYPLKLHEYLAAGRAIVATALPELQQFRHVVRIADTYDAFVQQIGAAVHDYAPQTVAARVAVAQENTWDQRVAEIYRILHHQLTTAQGGHLEKHVHRLDTVRPAS